MSMFATQTAKKPASLRRNESGVASFLVTLVLMIVITLIVIGFAQIARRNQREALDDQLSSQAFYAAETGVNLVRNLLGTYQPSQLAKTTCDPGGAALYTSTQLSDNTTKVYNTCLLVNPSPTSLVYDDISLNSKVVPLQPDAPNVYGFGTVKLVWKPKSAGTPNISSCPTQTGAINNFTPSGSWPAGCMYGVLRFDMVNVGVPGVTPLDETTLENQTMTVFAPPVASHAPIVKNEGAADGTPGNVVCTSGADSACSLSITHVDLNKTHYLRLTSLYNDTAISSISATSDAGIPVKLVNAQLAIDSTGKAVDVLRRVSVRIAQQEQTAPSYAIQGSAGICKLYTSTGPGSFSGTCP